MTLRATWPDGAVVEARDYGGLTAAVAAMPWNAGHEDIRNELSRRAYVWSGAIVDPTLPDEQLWAQLEEAGIVRVERRSYMAARYDGIHDSAWVDVGPEHLQLPGVAAEL
jgi:hypothetical protein